MQLYCLDLAAKSAMNTVALGSFSRLSMANESETMSLLDLNDGLKMLSEGNASCLSRAA